MSSSRLRGPLTDSERKWREQFIRKVEAIKGNGEMQTAFLDPLQLELAEGALQETPHLSYSVFGGYGGAERVCLKIFSGGRPESPPKISCLVVNGAFDEQTLTHRDFLGSVLGLGLRRDQVGDILPLPDGRVAIIVVETMGDFICSQLIRVGSVPVECSLVEPSELPLPAEEGKEISGTVASLRLDSVISIGFGFSRSRAALLVKGGLAKVNWRSVDSPSYQIKEGDLLSLQGRGRLELLSVEGETRKGRIRLRLKKFS